MATSKNIFMSNGMPIVANNPHDFKYHMNWDTLQIMQPNKVPILERWFSAIGKYPQKNSIPVFDITDGIIYAGAGLEYPANDRHYVKTYNMVINCIEKNKPFRPYKRAIEITPYDQHYFMAVEDVPIIILEDALNKYKDTEEKSYQKAKAYTELEKALAEAKELLK